MDHDSPRKLFITIVCDIFRKKEITMIAIKAIIITTISINFMVNSTKFGSTTKFYQNIEQIPEQNKILPRKQSLP